MRRVIRPHDVAVMDEWIQQRGRHLGVEKATGPFREAHIRGTAWTADGPAKRRRSG